MGWGWWGISRYRVWGLCPLPLPHNRRHHHRHRHFICPIIHQYAHLHEYNSRRAGQQGPIRTLTAALKRSIKTVTGCCIFYHTNKNITNICPIIQQYAHPTGWLGSRVVSVLDSGEEGPGFKSQSRRCRVTVLGKLFTPIVHLFTKQPS